MVSLNNLSKYLYIYRSWKNIIEDTGLKWSNGNSEDLVINRLMSVKDPSEIVDWICTIKSKALSLSTFMDFVIFTVVRFVEAVNSYNLIITLN
jgi:hypothetical protein